MLDFKKLDHEHFMGQALIEATAAGQAGDRPIGAVIVCDNEIVARGRNRIRSTQNRRAHAEIDALNNAIAVVETHAADCVVYTTMEPCPMCLGSIAVAEIGAIVFGLADPARGGTHMVEQVPFVQMAIKHYVGGVLASPCEEILQKFA